MKRWWIIALCVALLLSAVLGWGRLVMFAHMYNPFSERWIGIQFNNGDILYGKLAAITASTLYIKDARTIETFTKGPDASAVSMSSSFMLGRNMGGSEKQVTVSIKKAYELFVSRASVQYWRFIESDGPLSQYLK